MENIETKNNEIEKALYLLDREYFHICKELNEKGETSNWVVYYKDMNDEDFLSVKNKPLLNSQYSTIEDIMRVKEQFDRSRIKADDNITWEKIKLYNVTFDYISKMVDEFFKISMILEFVFLIFFILFAFFIKQIFLIPSMLIAFSIVLICLDYLQDKVKDGSKDVLNKNKDILLKNELKHKRGNVYEFRKKSRTNSIKKI